MKFKYKSLVPGIVIGKAYVIAPVSTPYPKFWISDREIASEILRLKRSIQKSKDQLNRIKDKMCKFKGKEQFNIIESYSLILQDEMLITNTVQLLTSQKINAEWSVEKALTEMKLAFAEMNDEYFQERAHDLEYVGKRILRNLQGTADLTLDILPKGKYILVTNDLSPADIASLPRDKIEGFIIASGGETSHTAIIARSLEVPAVLGRPDIVNAVTMGDQVIIDGTEGEVIINPTNDSLADYQKQRLNYKKIEQRLIKTSHIQAKTIDDRKINVVANIELIEEVPSALDHGAEGIGLYRTEFFYANRVDYPTEEDLVQNFEGVLRMMGPRAVTIRTLDIGGDKLFYSGEYAEHLNPALGLRAIRFSLYEKEMLTTQIRALLRANKFGNLRVMIPMVSDVSEIRQVKKMFEDEKKKLASEGKEFNDNFKLGIMVEVPSAVMIADILAKEVDFFSIGTNDLIQYTLAVDRTNESISYLYQPLHPAILRLIARTVEAGKNANIEVNICGEMAGDPLHIMVLMGLGLDGLSMNPMSIPRVKEIIRNMKYSDAKLLADEVLNLATAGEVEALVNKKTMPIIEKTMVERSKHSKRTKLRGY